MAKPKKRPRGRPVGYSPLKNKKKSAAKKAAPRKKKGPAKTKKPGKHDLVTGRFCIGSAVQNLVELEDGSLSKPSADHWPKVYETLKEAEAVLLEAKSPDSDQAMEHVQELHVYQLKKFFANSYKFESSAEGDQVLSVGLTPVDEAVPLRAAVKGVRGFYQSGIKSLKDDYKEEIDFIDQQIKEIESQRAAVKKASDAQVKTLEKSLHRFDRLLASLKI